MRRKLRPFSLRTSPSSLRLKALIFFWVAWWSVSSCHPPVSVVSVGPTREREDTERVYFSLI
jgi:hypothetical protein